MTWTAAILALLLPAAVLGAEGAGAPPRDLIRLPQGILAVTFIGHGTLMLEWAGKVVHVDPWSKLADYAALPKADLVLITHDHQDHLDARVVELLRKEDTVVVASPKAAIPIPGAVVMRNGDTRTFSGLTVTAVPAYNLVHLRDTGIPYHPKGEGNGYLIDCAGALVYVAGDTENIPEMSALAGKVAVAFLPMNLPYTMTPEMAAEAARRIRPRILYPYHTGETDVAKLAGLLASERGIDLKLRPMK